MFVLQAISLTPTARFVNAILGVQPQIFVIRIQPNVCARRTSQVQIVICARKAVLICRVPTKMVALSAFALEKLQDVSARIMYKSLSLQWLIGS